MAVPPPLAPPAAPPAAWLLVRERMGGMAGRTVPPLTPPLAPPHPGAPPSSIFGLKRAPLCILVFNIFSCNECVCTNLFWYTVPRLAPPLAPPPPGAPPSLLGWRSRTSRLPTQTARATSSSTSRKKSSEHSSGTAPRSGTDTARSTSCPVPTPPTPHPTPSSTSRRVNDPGSLACESVKVSDASETYAHAPFRARRKTRPRIPLHPSVSRWNGLQPTLETHRLGEKGTSKLSMPRLSPTQSTS